MRTSPIPHKPRRLARFARADEAVSALEYAILVGVVAVGVAAALGPLSTVVQNALTGIASRAAPAISSAGAPAPAPAPPPGPSSPSR